jgi:hypothetical protein
VSKDLLIGLGLGWSAGFLAAWITLRRWMRASKSYAEAARGFHQAAEGCLDLANQQKTLAEQAEARVSEWVT